MAKKMVWCMVFYEMMMMMVWLNVGTFGGIEAEREIERAPRKYSNWKNFPKIYNSIRCNPIATVE